MRKMKILDHEALLTLNESSLKAGRGQNLKPQQIPAKPQPRYWVNDHLPRERDGLEEVRACVVLDISAGKTVWLDMSPHEFAAIPELELSEDEWETAMCAGTPPQVA